MNEKQTKGQEWLNSRSLFTQNKENLNVLNKSIILYSSDNIKVLNQISQKINLGLNQNKILFIHTFKKFDRISDQLKILNDNFSNIFKGQRAKNKDTTIREEDLNLKLYHAVDDLESLMKENNKIQKKQLEDKGKGLLGLFGGLAKFAAMAIMGGGLLGFLLTGKEEFLFSLIKGFKKVFFDIPKMMTETAKAVKNIPKIFSKIPKAVKGAKRIATAFKHGGFRAARKAISRMSSAGKLAGKVAEKAAGKAASKVAAKKIPVVGSLLALWFAIERFKKGDVVGGLLEIGSGLAGFLHLIPGIGTVAAVGIQLLIDGIILARDFAGIVKHKEKEKIEPKKSEPSKLRKMPVIGGLFTFIDGLKMMMGGEISRGIKLSLVGIGKLLPVPGMTWFIKNVGFTLVDAGSALVKSIPDFLGIVGDKAVEMVPATYDFLKKVPVIGWFISGIEGIINFTKNPKKGIENIANFMNNVIPGSGDLILKAGSIIFGAASWVMEKGQTILKWGGDVLKRVKESVKNAIKKEIASLESLENEIVGTDTSSTVSDIVSKDFDVQKPSGDIQKPLNGIQKLSSDIKKKPSNKKSLANFILKRSEDFRAKAEEFRANVELSTSKDTKVGGKLIENGVHVLTGVNVSGIRPDIWSSFLAMADEYKQLTGKDILITSGFRSLEKQKELYDEAVKKYGPILARKYVAPPGRSMHNFGYAIDIDNKMTGAGDRLERLGLLKKYGFSRPMSHEPWHIEPEGLFRKYADIREGKYGDSLGQQAGDAYAIKNLPSSPIPSIYKNESINKIDLSESTISQLAREIGVAFKKVIPSQKNSWIAADVKMRG